MIKKIIYTMIIVLISISLTVLFFLKFVFRPQVTDVNYGDIFPNVDIYTASNVKIDSLPHNNNYNVKLYLSNSCSTCVEKLDTISRLSKIYKLDDISFQLIWQDTIPKKRIEESGIDISDNVTLRNKASLFRTTPGVFITNSKNEVVFTTEDFKALYNKLYSIGQGIDLKACAINTILDEAKILKNSDIPVILFFTSQGCDACVKAEKKLYNNDIVKNKVNIITISDEQVEKDGLIYDPDGIYKKILNINVFPSFMLISNLSEITETDYFTDIDQLFDHLNI